MNSQESTLSIILKSLYRELESSPVYKRMHYLIFVDFIINNLMKSDELILMGKGSGSGGCLMNNNNDEAEFIKLPLKIKIKDIDVSGSFVIAIDIYDDLYIWGTLHKTLLK